MFVVRCLWFVVVNDEVVVVVVVVVLVSRLWLWLLWLLVFGCVCLFLCLRVGWSFVW